MLLSSSALEPSPVVNSAAQSIYKAWQIVQQRGCRSREASNAAVAAAGRPARALTFQATAAAWNCTVESRHAITLRPPGEHASTASTLGVSWATVLRVTSQVRAASLVGTREIRGLALDGSTLFVHEHPLGVSLQGNHCRSVNVRRTVHDAFDNEWQVSEKHLIDSTKSALSQLAFIVVRLTIRAERWSCDQLVLPRESTVLVRILSTDAVERSAVGAKLRLWCSQPQEPSEDEAERASKRTTADHVAYLFHPFAAADSEADNAGGGWIWSLPATHPQCPDSQTLDSLRASFATLVDRICCEASPHAKQLLVAFPIETTEKASSDFFSRVPLEAEVHTWETLLDTHIVFFTLGLAAHAQKGAQVTADDTELYRVDAEATQMLLAKASRSRPSPSSSSSSSTSTPARVRLQLFIRTARGGWKRQLPTLMEHCAALDASLCDAAARRSGVDFGLPHAVEVVLLRARQGEAESAQTDLAILSHYHRQLKLRHVQICCVADEEQLDGALFHSVANWFCLMSASDFPKPSATPIALPGAEPSWLLTHWWALQCSTGSTGLLRSRTEAARQLRETFSFVP
jgi:hypothetical protein